MEGTGPMEGSNSPTLEDGTDLRVARLEAQLTRCRADLRDVRAAEARCLALFEQSPLSIQVHGLDGRCRVTNPAHDRLWNVTCEQMAAWDPRTDPQLADAGVGAMFECAFAGEAQVVPAVWFDAARVAPGGKRAWVDTVAFPLRDEAGRVAEVAVVHQDVTALRRAERLARGQANVIAGTLERLAREPDLDAFIGHVLADVANQLGAAAGQVTTYDVEAGTLTAVAEIRDGQAAAAAMGGSVACQPGHFFDLLLAEDGPRRFDLDAEGDLFWPGALAFHRAEGHRCVLAVPLLVGPRKRAGRGSRGQDAPVAFRLRPLRGWAAM